MLNANLFISVSNVNISQSRFDSIIFRNVSMLNCFLLNIKDKQTNNSEYIDWRYSNSNCIYIPFYNIMKLNLQIFHKTKID